MYSFIQIIGPVFKSSYLKLFKSNYLKIFIISKVSIVFSVIVLKDLKYFLTKYL